MCQLLPPSKIVVRIIYLQRYQGAHRTSRTRIQFPLHVPRAHGRSPVAPSPCPGKLSHQLHMRPHHCMIVSRRYQNRCMQQCSYTPVHIETQRLLEYRIICTRIVQSLKQFIRTTIVEYKLWVYSWIFVNSSQWTFFFSFSCSRDLCLHVSTWAEYVIVSSLLVKLECLIFILPCVALHFFLSYLCVLPIFFIPLS